MRRTAKIYVAGHTGLVGSSLHQRLAKYGYHNLVYRNRRNLDLTNQESVDYFFREARPEYVFMCAGKVGGIGANSKNNAGFLYDNMMMAMNVINAAYRFGVKKLVYLGSSCIYPKDTAIPIKESQLFSGKLEPTNEGYAVAKIAGIELCKFYNQEQGREFISVIPCNLYGPRDTFDLDSGHFIPAMIHKVWKAKKENTDLTIWGTGEPVREFLYTDDLAEALMTIMREYTDSEPINVGTGVGTSIWRATQVICQVMGYNGNIKFDKDKPDGQMEKTMDVTKIQTLGWNPKTDFMTGIMRTVDWFTSVYGG